MASDASGPSWLPPAEAMNSDPPSVAAGALGDVMMSRQAHPNPATETWELAWRTAP